jgi:hypothetical protein
MSSRHRSSSQVSVASMNFAIAPLAVPLGQLALLPDVSLDDLQAKLGTGRITDSLAIGRRSSRLGIARAAPPSGSPYRSTCFPQTPLRAENLYVPQMDSAHFVELRRHSFEIKQAGKAIRVPSAHNYFHAVSGLSLTSVYVQMYKCAYEVEDAKVQSQTAGGFDSQTGSPQSENWYSGFGANAPRNRSVPETRGVEIKRACRLLPAADKP